VDLLGHRSRRMMLGAVIAASAPMTLATEHAVRPYVLSPEILELRLWIADPMTDSAWLVVWSCGLFVLLAAAVMQRMLKPWWSEFGEPQPPRSVQRRFLNVVMISTSIVQAPAILQTFLVMLGADLRPALITMVVTSVAIVGIMIALEVALAGVVRSPPHDPSLHPRTSPTT